MNIKRFGVALFAVGLVVMLYYLFNFDTVASEGLTLPTADEILHPKPVSYDRGLLAQKVCGCVFGAALTISGAVMMSRSNKEQV